MHPAQLSEFEWDDYNIEHLSAHGITPEDVMQVWLNGAIWVPNPGDHEAEWRMLGYTDGGRALTIVVRVDEEDELLRAFTGHDMTKAESARYGQYLRRG